MRLVLRLLGCALSVIALASVASARSATLTASARLRQGPAATTDLVGDLPAGTRLKIIGERGGWRQVETPDGKTGFVWAENLTEDPDAPAAQTAPPRPDAPKTDVPKPEAPRQTASVGSSTMADDLRAVRDDVKALRERPEPAAAEAVERLRADVDRLTKAQHELAQHIEDRTPTGIGGDPPTDGSLTIVPALLVGGVLGWIASRLIAGRRDRRQRNRLRL